MKFRIRAQKKDGNTYTETMEAADRFQVYRDMRGRGDQILDMKEAHGAGAAHAGGGGFSIASLANLRIFGGVSLDEKVVLARNLAAMIEAGLTITRSLDVMKRQTTNQEMKKVLGAVGESVQHGKSFSDALTAFPKVFPSVFVAMARAGEESGKLADALRVTAMQMERASNLEKKVRGALIYPGIVLSAIVVIAGLLLAYVVPTLTATFDELHAELPASTRFIIAASNFLIHDTLYALLALIALVIVVVGAARTPAGKRFRDWIVLKIPIIGPLIVEIYAARTTRTLASLFSVGVDMVMSIKITKDVLTNSRYKKVLSEAEARLTEGAPLSVSLAKHPDLFPPLVTEIVAVGEETGKLSELLKETAEFYEGSVERQTKDLSTVIEPVLMLLVGATVGFFAISMIAPIYSLSNAF